MFEIGLCCRLDAPSGLPFSHFSIKGISLFEHPDVLEYSGAFSQGTYSFLSRLKKKQSHAEKGDKKIWIFGTVFTNQTYAASIGEKPKRIYAEEVLNITIQAPDKVTDKIKGSFVIIFWEASIPKLTIITDRHNVLPLYYHQQGKRLFIASNIPLLVKMADLKIKIDPVGFASQLVFDFPVRDLHYIQGIKRFLAASIYSFDKYGLERNEYWSVTSLYHENLLPPKDSLELLSKILVENIALYSEDAPKLLVSLTGGFDGRTNLSMLQRPREDFLTYSYGMPGSLQIRIPQEISRKIGIRYQPIYLKGEFLTNYSTYSHNATVYSNGLAPIGFANIDYAFAQLSDFANTALTGLFGSEILRPLSPGLGIQMNDRVFDLFFDTKGREKVREYVKQFFRPSELINTVFKEGLEALFDIFESEFVEKHKTYNPVNRSFFFLLEEGMPKYFQQEIQIERTYVDTRSPYLDSDLLDLIYRTPFAGMYNGFLGNNKIKKRRGQLLYVRIMEKYFPELNRIRVDRLYKPIDLIRPFPINYLLLAIGVTRKNLYMKSKGGNDTFKTNLWTRSTIENILNQHAKNPLIDITIKDRLKDYSNRNEATDITFRHLIAIIEFMNYLNDENSKTQGRALYQEKLPGQSLLHS